MTAGNESGNYSPSSFSLELEQETDPLLRHLDFPQHSNKAWPSRNSLMEMLTKLPIFSNRNFTCENAEGLAGFNG